MVVAMEWVHRITGVSLQMVLPAALGYWLDSRWGTEPWLVAIGAVLGFIVAMRQLLLWAGKGNKRSESQGSGPQGNRSKK